MIEGLNFKSWESAEEMVKSNDPQIESKEEEEEGKTESSSFLTIEGQIVEVEDWSEFVKMGVSLCLLAFLASSAKLPLELELEMSERNNWTGSRVGGAIPLGWGLKIILKMKVTKISKNWKWRK